MIGFSINDKTIDMASLCLNIITKAHILDYMANTNTLRPSNQGIHDVKKQETHELNKTKNKCHTSTFEQIQSSTNNPVIDLFKARSQSLAQSHLETKTGWRKIHRI
jgi:hypothetical protein